MCRTHSCCQKACSSLQVHQLGLQCGQLRLVRVLQALQLSHLYMSHLATQLQDQGSSFYQDCQRLWPPYPAPSTCGLRCTSRLCNGTCHLTFAGILLFLQLCFQVGRLTFCIHKRLLQPPSLAMCSSFVALVSLRAQQTRSNADVLSAVLMSANPAPTRTVACSHWPATRECRHACTFPASCTLAAVLAAACSASTLP